MAVIRYEYVRYTFSKKYYTPVTRQEFDALQVNKKLFITNYNTAHRKQFRDRQGMIGVICFYITAAFITVGVGVTVPAIASPKVLDAFEKLGDFSAVLGVLYIVALLFHSTGLGYWRSWISLNNYPSEAKQCYDRQYAEIKKSMSHDQYVASVRDRAGFKACG